MLQITSHHRILLSVEPADFRKGIDSLVALCKRCFSCDPLDGAVFVFTNRRKISIKILAYDGNGFWLCQKRFSSGKLKWWPSNPEEARRLRPSELQVIFAQGVPTETHIPSDFRKVA